MRRCALTAIVTDERVAGAGEHDEQIQHTLGTDRLRLLDGVDYLVAGKLTKARAKIVGCAEAGVGGVGDATHDRYYVRARAGKRLERVHSL